MTAPGKTPPGVAAEIILGAVLREEAHPGVHLALPPQLKLAKQLIAYRRAARLGRWQLARKALVKVADLKEWEDAQAFPGDEEIERLARVLNDPAATRDDLECLTDYWKFLAADAAAFLEGR